MRQATVNELPVELLRDILVEGTWTESPPIHISFDLVVGYLTLVKKPKGNDEDSHGPTPWTEKGTEDGPNLVLPFPVIALHVCRHWRQAALDTPTLWTYLTFKEDSPFEKSIEWISRSKNAPLTICYNKFVPNNINEAYRNRESIAINELKHLEAVIDIILPHAHRCKEFYVDTYAYEPMRYLLAKISTSEVQATGAPILSLLFLRSMNRCQDLDIAKHSQVGNRARRAAFRHKPEIFGGKLPSLEHLVLDVDHMDWAMLAPMFSVRSGSKIKSRNEVLLQHLTKLRLESSIVDMDLSVEQFAAVLTSCPNIESLALRLSWPDFEATASSIDDIASPICTPKLSALELAFLYPNHVLALLKKVFMPELRKLTLDFKGSQTDYSEVIKYLTSTTQCIPTAMDGTNGSTEQCQWKITDKITELKLGGMQCGEREAVQLYWALKNLTSLDLTMSDLDTMFGGMLMESFPESNDPDGPGVNKATFKEMQELKKKNITVAFLHNLRKLTVTSVAGHNLRQVVDARKEGGVPLEEVIVCASDYFRMFPGDWMYLVSNVPRVGKAFVGEEEEGVVRIFL